MKYDVNRFGLYWTGQDQHIMVLAYSLPGTSAYREVARMITTTGKLHNFLAMVQEGETRGWDNIAWLDGSGRRLQLSIQVARQCREMVVTHLKKLAEGTLKISHPEDDQISGEFSDN